MEIHVLRSGETLSALARTYQVSVEQIQNVNGITDPNRMVVGQAILIPTPRGTYVVQPGDTLMSIATRYGTTPAALATQNNLANPNQLYVGQRLRVPERARGTIEVNAYLTDFGVRGEQTVREIGGSLTYLSPFSYRAQRNGDLTPINDTNVLEVAKTQGVMPMLVLANWEGNMFNSDLARAIFDDEAVQARLIANLLEVMAAKGYRALNIDFEYIYPSDKEKYNEFLQKVVTDMHAKGYLVSTALAPKTSATQTGLLYEAHDYPTHGRLCDFVVLMTYEWGWIGGQAMAVSPVPQIEQVLDYAVSVIPPSKILTGISVYGYDWTLPFTKGSLAQTLTPLGAVALAARNNVAIQYDKTAQAPYFRYTDSAGKQHIVWFEDPRSFQAKLDVVKSYGLRGISFWTFPTSFPQIPAILRNNFRVRKL